MRKMKKLEELGISPAPWECATNDRGEVVGTLNGRGFYVAKFAYDITPNNARLIAAAPELYECLREEFEKVCTNDGKCTDCQFVSQCRVKKWRTALAKASGEGDVK